MLVYGDRSELADPAERLALLAGQLADIKAMPAGIRRHAMLVTVLIGAGQLLQAVADEGACADGLSTFVHQLGRCVIRSLDSEYADCGELPGAPDASFPGPLHLRVPEGFAFYAVFPESYVAAARKLQLVGPPRVIGIRSIGTTLAAIVAAALDAPPPTTVRPFGDPFARKVELAPEILDDRSHFIIVDEGPGLSGSSFGAVADWLEARGVPLGRIAFLPSHSGDPGAHASKAHRQRWSNAQRVAAAFDRTFLEQLFGPLEEFAAGGPWQRLKFIGRRIGAPVLIKFAGLGDIGERKLQIARALHAGGFTPEPLDLVHGFLVERWRSDARPLSPEDRPVEEIANYVGARALLLPAPVESGASVEQLLAMCSRNIALLLGSGPASKIDCFNASQLEQRVRPRRTDNKMQPEEWLRAKDGSLLKTDAVDHHQAHDLIGCQGFEWDVAGFIEEFGLDAVEQRRLIEALPVAADFELLRFYRIAYAAFRAGQCDLSGADAAAERYARSLKHLLHHQNS